MISFRGDDHQRRSTESRCQSGSGGEGDTGSADIRSSLCDYKLKAPEARESGVSSPKCKRGLVAGACPFSPSAAENVGIALANCAKHDTTSPRRIFGRRYDEESSGSSN